MAAYVEYKYLSEQQIKGFDKYKYNSVDTSPVSKYITHPFWNRVVLLYPEWVAPNVLTFTGFVLLVISFLLLTFYDNHFYASCNTYTQYAPIHPWVWIICGLFQFTAHTLDGTDGKQARRTNSSSPLGELFDHGVDSWSCLLMPTAVYSIFGRDLADYGGNVNIFYIVLWGILIGFIISHWEKYITGVLYLPWGYDVSQLGLALIYFLTAIWGTKMWKGKFCPWFQTNYFLIFLLCAGILFSVCQSLYNIYCSYQEGSGNKLTFSEAVWPIFPITVLFMLATLWVCCSHVDVLSREPRLLFVAIGTIFSNITCRLIVSQMSSTKAPTFNALLIPLTLVVIPSVAIDLGQRELYLLYTLVTFTTLAHVHYGVCVVRQMCDHFNIFCFVLKKTKGRR